MTEHNIAIVTDSTCDIPEKLLEQYNIYMVPLSIIWGSDDLKDGVDITADAFYTRLTRDPVLPTTSQPTPQAFVDIYQQAIDEGAQEIVVLTISSGLSGTYASAEMAVSMSDAIVHLYDSKGASMSLGWQVLAAARAREAGGDANAMLSAARKVRNNAVLFVSLDTLEYLHRGGRIGGASRYIGTMLNIKPSIYVDHKTGLIDAGSRSRTRKRAIKQLYEDFFSQVQGSEMHIAVLYSDDMTDAQTLANQLKREYESAEIIIARVSPVLGVHVGPGAVGLTGYAL
ncbi:MAG: DegV family protein [Anaerolineae bacterium]|nr:DegV family protein [Anaerolineae bacterium]